MAKHTQTIRRQFAGELFECVWPFFGIVENLREWTERNLAASKDKPISFQPRKERILETSQRQWMKNHYNFL